MNTLSMTCIEIAPQDGWGVVRFDTASLDPTIWASGMISIQVTDYSKFTVGALYDLNLNQIK